MSKFPSLRLMGPLCGALLLMSAPCALAQDGALPQAEVTAQYPAPAKTPEAAGERFYQLLSLFPALEIPMLSEGAFPPPEGTMGEDYDVLPHYDVSAISREQYEKAILYHEFPDPDSRRSENIFAAMARLKDEPQFEGKVVGKEGEQTLVEVSPAPPKKRAVAVVAEDGGYRVDLKATWGRWNNLSGKSLDLSWYKFTGDISASLVNDPEFMRVQENARRSSCQSNLKQAMLGILQYAQDYNETYPPARKWIDEIFPYVRSEQIFRCPALPDGDNYGYALNQNLNSIKTARMDNVAQTVAIYETDSLVRNEFGVGEERAYRHGGGSNLAFADGHVKWFAQGTETPEAVSFKP